MADWRFFMKCERDEELIKGERKRLIRGIASTEAKDRHDEEMVLSGMDFNPYLEKGHLNWDHMKGPQFILGKPLEAKVVSDGSSLKKGINGPAFFHLVELYDTDPGRAAWDLMKTEEGDPNRNYGFSVEGAILETKGNRLLKTRVDDVALTPQPANPETFCDLIKSLTATGEGSSPLLNQYVDDNQRDSKKAELALSGIAQDIMLGKCKNGCFDQHGQLWKGAQGAYIHLVHCLGHNEDQVFEAVKTIRDLAKRGIS